MSIASIAKVCHNANKAYCETIGDDSQRDWDHAEEWQRESAMKGVQFIIDNPTAGPDAAHQSWLDEKKRDGWKYGALKDPAKKEHPCFVPYDQLPHAQRLKDYLFAAVVRVLQT